MILVSAGYSAEETWEWSWPKFRMRALIARRRELERNAEQSLAVWDAAKFSRLLDDLDRELDHITCPPEEEGTP